jgi:predicted DNA-binding antitoxin AbrB/MazE fold protein
MSRAIPAIFDAGVFRPLEPVELAEGTQVEVTVGPAPVKEESQQGAPMAWRDFVERTYGSCAGLGLERHEQGAFESREPIA